jgi:hypothetical protein
MCQRSSLQASHPELPVRPGENHILITWLPNVPKSFQSATSTSRGIRAGVAQGGLVSPVLLGLYTNNIPTPSRNFELVQYADNTALVATSRSPSLLVGYLEAYLGTI